MTPPKNGYLLAGTRRGALQILDQSSNSQIHLWHKSQISNLKSLDGCAVVVSGAIVFYLLQIICFGCDRAIGKRPIAKVSPSKN
ncbi:MAG: hypothetical protein JGK17_18725 [Microcoleus sp. PH2017_10_PVI_O_A]|uniref:hypothetical protein n=1 Tax=unclassified Microcoleus TaxID=2642155 RepID=UPI001D722475|nr:MULTISPECIES: hypothetical protein [unclassified Microcoleus]MCC3407589.1 hypothetical protein [Microcoleus sp. PH2017_10_PVI_O_A]MCC3461766.1 hypothetical protein [Microcoleus sp. PH2017_11_PCY_U_A]MCC3480180.1 hypothetical protein [Microcoleus sp. PH2017_12_PCY_D_A]MCC3531753.1 hypothetical protein [Microcoleus sp. PH2017_21_RUC_O_A]MCC3544066.1 hypothetical protein [Microcoleus sp. PH2017_22_RUC_O_B]